MASCNRAREQVLVERKVEALEEKAVVQQQQAKEENAVISQALESTRRKETLSVDAWTGAHAYT